MSLLAFASCGTGDGRRLDGEGPGLLVIPAQREPAGITPARSPGPCRSVFDERISAPAALDGPQLHLCPSLNK
jgi:hypothetical protein